MPPFCFGRLRLLQQRQWQPLPHCYNTKGDINKHGRNLLRTLTTTPPIRYANKPLPPRPVVDETTITESFLKGTGPGGQKINKTSSAVQLKHLPTGIVIKCQETRSRTQNRKIARRILAERIEDLELGDASRTAVKLERASKKKASKDKKSRRKYRKLATQGEADQRERAEGEEEGGAGGDTEEDVVEIGSEDDQARNDADSREPVAQKTASPLPTKTTNGRLAEKPDSNHHVWKQVRQD